MDPGSRISQASIEFNNAIAGQPIYFRRNFEESPTDPRNWLDTNRLNPARVDLPTALHVAELLSHSYGTYENYEAPVESPNATRVAGGANASIKFPSALREVAAKTALDKFMSAIQPHCLTFIKELTTIVTTLLPRPIPQDLQRQWKLNSQVQKLAA